MLLLRYILMTLALASLAGAMPAAAETGAPGANHIRATLVSETAHPAPGGAFTVALAMAPDPGWHGYWKNTGDAGMETRLRWTLPAGASAGPIVYPVPQRLLIAGLMNYVYEARYAMLVTIRLPKGIKPGTALPLRVDADWLACTDTICVPEKQQLALDLVVGDGAVTPADRSRFDTWRAATPRPLGGQGHFGVKGEAIRIGIPLPAAVALSDPYFYPLTKDAIDYAAPQQFSRSGDTLILETKAAKGTAPAALEGVLKIGPNMGLAVHAAPGDVPAGGVALAADTGDSGSGKGADVGTIVAALAAAVLGGLLLNVMPCVFPILSLKALSLARAGGDERHVRREALAYAGGVILVCVALGAMLLILRAGGTALGWAFQLQDPRVILLLLLLVGAIAFNLAGLFELPMLSGGEKLAQAGGVTGAFWTGALAAFIATPCTGPFMAGALGAALVLPPIVAMLIFFGLGFGLALPFLLLGYIPALRRILPRPGPWMGTLRHILSLPMFLTALGLAWILGRQAGIDAMTLGLGALLLLVAALWWVGRRQASGRSGAWRPAIPALAASIAIALLIPQQASVAKVESVAAGTEPFSEARLAALRKEGAPVFLYFTADWCLTCKVNEKAAIERAEVHAAFAKGGVKILVGDWTRGDAAIGHFLEAQGRSGVPLYLFYPRGGGEPQILPQVLTPGLLTGLAGTG